MKTTNLMKIVAVSVMGAASVANASVSRLAGTWTGTGTTYSLDGDIRGTYGVQMVDTVESDGSRSGFAPKNRRLAPAQAERLDSRSMVDSAKTAKLDVSASLTAEDALFRGKVRGLVATLHANERPLRGLVGILDWRFRGEISRALRAGALGGVEGECAYLPLTISRRSDSPADVFHLILFGRGPADRAGGRAIPPANGLSLLRKNLLSLKIEPIGVSRSDFGNPPDDRFFETALKGVPFCVVP